MLLSEVCDEAGIEVPRDAVFWTPGLTLSSLVEDALIEAITKLEFERGSCFPPRRANLKAGRPIK